MDINEEPQNVKELRREHDELFEHLQTQTNEYKAKGESMGDKYHGLERLSELSDALAEHGGRLAKEQQTWMEQVAPEREALTRQLADLREQMTGPDVKALEGRLQYLQDAIQPVTNIVKFRLWFEMLFPIVFGAAAIVLCILGGFWWPIAGGNH
jgi:gas vesicle protein